MPYALHSYTRAQVDARTLACAPSRTRRVGSPRSSCRCWSTTRPARGPPHHVPRALEAKLRRRRAAARRREVLLAVDEHPRPDVPLEKIAKLPCRLPQGGPWRAARHRHRRHRLRAPARPPARPLFPHPCSLLQPASQAASREWFGRGTRWLRICLLRASHKHFSFSCHIILLVCCTMYSTVFVTVQVSTLAGSQSERLDYCTVLSTVQ